MDTNFGRFKMLALRTMASDGLKDDANNARSFFKRISMTVCMCVGLYDRNQHCLEHEDGRNCTLLFCVEFCRAKPIRRSYSKMFRVSIVFSVVSQLSNL